MSKITDIKAFEILDSRGIPTVSVEVTLEDGTVAAASVPSGTSTGEFEALELRDGDEKRFAGKGVLKAVENVNKNIKELLLGEEATNQEDIDKKILEADGTPNKSTFGANAILGVSLAVSKAAALSLRKPLYEYLSEIYNLGGNWQESLGVEKKFKMPVPMSVMIEAGKHSTSNVEAQEFMVVPKISETFADSLEKITETYHKIEEVLVSKGKSANVGLEGAFGPELNSIEEALEIILEGIKKSGLKPGSELSLALDVAASEFYDKESKKYVLRSEGISLTENQMCGLLADWVENYPIISIEDGLYEEDWEGFKMLTQKLSGKALVVGDDLFVTNPKRLMKGIEQGAGNALIIKPNQIGTVSETLETIRIAKKGGYKTIVSHRSGETEETFIADLAVAVNSDFIKTGAPARGERVAKYNRLLEIEQELLSTVTGKEN